jgi:hypothetical protein
MEDQAQVNQRLNKNPVPYPQTIRPDTRSYRTSTFAGDTVPGAFIPLMPNEGIKAGSKVQLTIMSEETERMLANAVNVRCHAYFVSYAALDRFRGMDAVADAWAGVAGAESILEHVTYSGASHDQFYDVLGEHFQDGETISTAYVEAYNRVINFRREQVSITLPVRTMNDYSIARSLWGQTALSRIVPTFDAALEQAQVNLQFSGSDLALVGTAPLKNVGYGVSGARGDLYSFDGSHVGTNVSGEYGREIFTVDSVDSTNTATAYGEPQADLSAVVAELAGGAGTVSIAQIDGARRTQAMAKLRATYAGNDDALIDLLMRGFSIPNNAYRDPILIGSGRATFGQAQRNAQDGANLDTYVVNGQVQVSMPLAMPRQTTGGIVVTTYEITPEPIFDRQADMFLRETDATLPNSLVDFLDTQKVDVVPARFVDALHTAGGGDETWGYAPRNYHWARMRSGVGGRFKRELASDPNAEDQQNIWSVRSVDPELNADTFLVPAALTHNVFKDTTVEPFIVQHVHVCAIEGTAVQFGPALYESSGDYDAVAAVAPTDILTGADVNA